MLVNRQIAFQLAKILQFIVNIFILIQNIGFSIENSSNSLHLGLFVVYSKNILYLLYLYLL